MRIWLTIGSSRLSHILTPESAAALPSASGSRALFGLCGVVTWPSQAITSSAGPARRVCSLCISKESPLEH